MKVKKMKKSKKPMARATKKKKLDEVTVDEFLEQDFQTNTENDDDDIIKEGKAEGSDSENDLDAEEHKKSLSRLKYTDPEFYTYLKDNDKNLLDFNLSDDNDDASSDDESEQKHIPNENLEVASDESDYEPEDGTQKESSGTTKVTLQLLKSWQHKIETERSSKIIKCAVEAFHAALQTVSETNDDRSWHYRVEGGAVFNGVIQLCVLHLPNALKRFLNLSSDSHFDVHKCKKFPKIKGILKIYLRDLIQILENVTSTNILVVLLKHLHQMLPYTQSFSWVTKPLLRILLKLWTSGEETTRIVAFLCILRIATSRKEKILEILLKAMYVKYVENSKFVSPTTLPGINFMRHSLTEIYLLNGNISYTHAFLYVRQLAIHLRNALTLKKKEHFQAVYNWQYINSLRFWAELISQSKQQSMLHSLLYPLVQIIVGTIKVIPTAQYYPLRFHCVEMLINISKQTNTFIPILPFLLEVLNGYNFDKKHKVVSMKPLPLMCVLRMSKSQLQENGFKDSVIENLYGLILENASKDSHTIYFPDLYIPCIVQLKAFLKKCHVANYCRKMKQLLEKIEENRNFIESERAKVTFDLKDTSGIKNWENRIKGEGTPLAKFYESWKNIHQSRKLKLLTKNDEDVREYKLPTLRKKHKLNEDDEEESGDDSDDSDIIKLAQTPGAVEPRKTKNPKKKRKKPDLEFTSEKLDHDDIDPLTENTDIITDINSADWM